MPVWVMASWHLFNQGWFNRFAIRLMGGFSVNREGIDRQAVETAIDGLQEAKRPLLVFPEGTASRVNDRVLPLLEGVSFIARTAAKRRHKRDGGRVVIHPVAIKYLFNGDLAESITPVLKEIEHRLLWRPQDHLPILSRIRQIGEAMLTLKEMEYLADVQTGMDLADRQTKLINHLLEPLEVEWLGASQSGGVVARIKAIRMKILPEMINEQLPDEETSRRWRHLEDTYLAQQIFCYPADYLAERASIDRVLETVERFEEDLTDKARVHGSLKAIIHVDEPIIVSTKRDRTAKEDPLMSELTERLQSRLDELALESPLMQNNE